MLVGIHKDPYGKFNSFLQRYETILDFNGIDHIRLEASQSDFWERIKTLDLFIFRWGHYDTDRQLAHTILPVIEGEMRIKCFPDWKTCWHYDDKIKEYYLLKHHGFPMVDSYIFWEKKAALEWLRMADFPVVFKLKGGAGSKNVALARNIRQAEEYVNKMFGKGLIPRSIDRNRINIGREIKHFGGNLLRRIRAEDVSENWQRQKNYVLFQKYLANNRYDTRVTVIGGRAFGYRRFVRKNDFRASGSGNFDVNHEEIDLRCVRIGLEVSEKMGFQSMTYDFLFDDDNNPQFSEISYTFVDWMVQVCPGYWDSNLNWHEGHFWPQYCQLVDVLDLQDLKQPDIEL